MITRSNLNPPGFLIWMSICLIAAFVPSTGHADRLSQTRFALNVSNADLREVLGLVAAKAGLHLAMEHDPGVTVSFSGNNVSAAEFIRQVSADHELEFSVRGDALVISKRAVSKVGVGARSQHYELQYASVADIAQKLREVVSAEDRLMADDSTNSVIFFGSDSSWSRVQELISILDQAPKQILIEALILETSQQFLRDLGIAIGDLSDRSLNNGSRVSAFTSTSQPTNPNSALKVLLGHLDGRALDLRLSAAETNGDAKVVSRPRVVTLNNKQAKIESGISFHVKTLSNISSGTSSSTSSSGVATGGVTTVSAGLTLDIHPRIVGSDQVRLGISINNSQPDEGVAVDGIPGVLNNSATTSVIVGSEQTAVIAGLIKQTRSHTRSAVPFLADIPILGILFRSDSRTERNNELVIFIKPTIQGQALPQAAEASLEAPRSDAKANNPGVTAPLEP